MANNQFFENITLGNAPRIKTNPRFQFDRGFELHLYGVVGEATYEAQYAFQGITHTVNTVVTKDAADDFYVAAVPDIMLFQPKEVHCYLYVETEEQGRTEYEVTIPVIPRSMPADGSYTPEETSEFNALLSELNGFNQKVKAITQVVYAGSGVLSITEEDEDIIFNKLRVDDAESAENAYEIARENGFTGTQAQWNAFVDELYDYTTPSEAYDYAGDAMDAALAASSDASDAMAAAESAVATANAAATAAHDNTITLLASGWTASGNVFTITVSCSIVTTSNIVFAGPRAGLTATQYDAFAYARIMPSAQGNGTITFTAYGDMPSIDLPIGVAVITEGTVTP